MLLHYPTSSYFTYLSYHLNIRACFLFQFLIYFFIPLTFLHTILLMFLFHFRPMLNRSILKSVSFRSSSLYIFIFVLPSSSFYFYTCFFLNSSVVLSLCLRSFIFFSFWSLSFYSVLSVSFSRSYLCCSCYLCFRFSCLRLFLVSFDLCVLLIYGVIFSFFLTTLSIGLIFVIPSLSYPYRFRLCLISAMFFFLSMTSFLSLWAL